MAITAYYITHNSAANIGKGKYIGTRSPWDGRFRRTPRFWSKVGPVRMTLRNMQSEGWDLTLVTVHWIDIDTKVALEGRGDVVLAAAPRRRRMAPFTARGTTPLLDAKGRAVDVGAKCLLFREKEGFVEVTCTGWTPDAVHFTRPSNKGTKFYSTRITRGRNNPRVLVSP